MSHRTCCLFVIAALCPATGFAAERGATLAGNSLAIDSPCARQVDVRVDPGLHGQVVVSATADHQEELDNLQFGTGAVARIKARQGFCWRSGMAEGFKPTLDLSVRIPENLALAVDESGVASYRLGPVGPLTIDLSGAAQVKGEQAGSVTIDLSGKGDVDLTRVGGDATIDLSGYGHVTIGQAAIGRLMVGLSGAGAVHIGAGHVDSARLDESGFGAIDIAAVVGDASVDLSGAGAVRFATITGTLTKDVSGFGSVKVNE